MNFFSHIYFCAKSWDVFFWGKIDCGNYLCVVTTTKGHHIKGERELYWLILDYFVIFSCILKHKAQIYFIMLKNCIFSYSYSNLNSRIKRQ